MIKIIPSSKFVTTTWKNGKGQTTELAISPNGTLNDFQWRLSIASVSEDGLFSDFSGYHRNLVLIEGQGITLTHNESTVDSLTNVLDFATFDGKSKTFGELHQGQIKDFNIMTKQGVFQAKVQTFTQPTEIIPSTSLAFAYSLSEDININVDNSVQHIIKQGDLLQISFADNSPNNIKIDSNQFIFIEISNQTNH